jgi:hypothetical protein
VIHRKARPDLLQQSVFDRSAVVLRLEGSVPVEARRPSGAAAFKAATIVPAILERPK